MANTTATTKKPKAPKRVTLTTAAEILKFRGEQTKLRERERVLFTVTFKPITDKAWLDGDSSNKITDGAGDPMPAMVLTMIVQGKSVTARMGDNSGRTDQSTMIHVFDTDKPTDLSSYDLIWIKPAAIVSLSYVPPKPLRKVGTPRPATLHVTGLQYGIEITDDDGVRGFKAGCNTVKNPEAIKVLEHLAAGLGYTVAIDPKATLKPLSAKKAVGTSKMIAGA